MMRSLSVVAAALLATTPAMAQDIDDVAKKVQILPVDYDITEAAPPRIRPQLAVVYVVEMDNGNMAEIFLLPAEPEWFEPQRVNLGNGFYLTPSQLRFEATFGQWPPGCRTT